MFKPVLRNIALYAGLALCLVPFLSRYHYLPLPQFFGEIQVVWLALLAFIPLVFSGKTITLPRVSIWLFVLSMLWVVQTQLMVLSFPGMNMVTALAFASLALIGIAIATLKTYFDANDLLRKIAWAIVIGACLQSMIGFLQVTGLVRLFGGLLFYDSGHTSTNVFGHLGQRNQYAQYLSWGLIAAVYLRVNRVMGKGLFGFLVTWLSISIVWAGSRTVLIYGFVIMLVALFFVFKDKNEDSKRMLKYALIATGAMMLFQFVLPVISSALSLSVSSSGLERLVDSGDSSMASRRVIEWTKAWMTFTSHPWFGVGWSQYAPYSVSLQTLPQFANAQFNSGLFTHSHNLVLQILAEMGMVGAIAVFAGLVWCLYPFFRHGSAQQSFLPLSVIAVSLVHSMLEYPWWYLYFPAVLTLLLAMSPKEAHTTKFWQWPCLAFALLLSVLSIQGYRTSVEMTGLYSKSSNPILAAKEDDRLLDMVLHEPLFAFHALNTLENHLSAEPQNIEFKIYWIERLAQFRPYPDVLLKLAKLYAFKNESEKSKEAMALALGSFPTYAPKFLTSLERENDARVKDLIVQTKVTIQALPPQFR